MGGKPTVRQVYALAAALCNRAGEAFPETFDEASDLIERLRREAGRPEPRPVDTALRPRWPGGRRGRRRRVPALSRGLRIDDQGASAVAAELVSEMH
jgi:hypothetical protein